MPAWSSQGTLGCTGPRGAVHRESVQGKMVLVQVVNGVKGRVQRVERASHRYLCTDAAAAITLVAHRIGLFPATQAPSRCVSEVYGKRTGRARYYDKGARRIGAATGRCQML
jgi:hypothetical protein